MEETTQTTHSASTSYGQEIGRTEEKRRKTSDEEQRKGEVQFPEQPIKKYVFLHGAALGVVKVGTALGDCDGTDTVIIEHDPDYAFELNPSTVVFQGNQRFPPDQQEICKLVGLGPSYKEYSKCQKMVVVERSVFNNLCETLIKFYTEAGVGKPSTKKRRLEEIAGVPITPSPEKKRSKIDDRFAVAFSDISPEEINELEAKRTAEEEAALTLERSLGYETELERKIEAITEPTLRERVIAQVLFD